jgi:hypothetical protein
MSVDLSARNASAAPQRAADALLRCLGGRTVLLRLPTNAVVGSDAEQLGAANPNLPVGRDGVIFWRAAEVDILNGVKNLRSGIPKEIQRSFDLLRMTTGDFR